MNKFSAQTQKGMVNPLVIVGVIIAVIVAVVVSSGAMKFSGSIKVDDNKAPQGTVEQVVSEPTSLPKVQSSVVLNEEPYTSADLNFSIKYPTGWEVKPQSSSVNIFLPKTAG